MQLQPFLRIERLLASSLLKQPATFFMETRRTTEEELLCGRPSGNATESRQCDARDLKHRTSSDPPTARRANRDFPQSKEDPV
jgi:hypothetical protein